VSLDGLPAAHLRVLLDGLPVFEPYGLLLAGGYAYARLVLRLPGSGEELEMDLLKEALEPRWVTVQITPAASVRAVSLDDTVGLKARAWHDRFVIRDIIDLHAVAGRHRGQEHRVPEILDATKSAHCDSVNHEKRVTVKM
jgi:Nucleotidyl transferase AbiEii toxin, Type IV TA system